MIDFILTKFQNLRFLGQFPTLLDPYRQRLLNSLSLSLVAPTCVVLIVCFLIIVPPQIATQPQGGPVTEGNNVTLSCNASGNPVPTITWTRNGSVLTSSVARISFGAESKELKIPSINRADKGEYRCVANNSEGNVTSDAATLDVQCEYTSCPFECDMTGKTSAGLVTTGLLLYIRSLG